MNPSTLPTPPTSPLSLTLTSLPISTTITSYLTTPLVIPTPRKPYTPPSWIHPQADPNYLRYQVKPLSPNHPIPTWKSLTPIPAPTISILRKSQLEAIAQQRCPSAPQISWDLPSSQDWFHERFEHLTRRAIIQHHKMQDLLTAIRNILQEEGPLEEQTISSILPAQCLLLQLITTQLIIQFYWKYHYLEIKHLHQSSTNSALLNRSGHDLTLLSHLPNLIFPSKYENDL